MFLLLSLSNFNVEKNEEFRFAHRQKSSELWVWNLPLLLPSFTSPFFDAVKARKSFQKRKSWLSLRCMRSKTVSIIAIISQENTEHQQKRQRIMIRAIFEFQLRWKLGWRNDSTTNKAKNATDRLYYIHFPQFLILTWRFAQKETINDISQTGEHRHGVNCVFLWHSVNKFTSLYLQKSKEDFQLWTLNWNWRKEKAEAHLVLLRQRHADYYNKNTPTTSNVIQEL